MSRKGEDLKERKIWVFERRMDVPLSEWTPPPRLQVIHPRPGSVKSSLQPQKHSTSYFYFTMLELEGEGSGRPVYGYSVGNLTEGRRIQRRDGPNLASLIGRGPSSPSLQTDSGEREVKTTGGDGSTHKLFKHLKFVLHRFYVTECHTWSPLSQTYNRQRKPWFSNPTY